jgi:hypothetical protein
VVDVTWDGSHCIELTYKDTASHLGSELLYLERAAYPACEVHNEMQT